MKKRIAIITLSGNYNYGNRLQNYAMQEAYKKLELEVETIWSTIDLNDGKRFTLKQIIKKRIKKILKIEDYDYSTYLRYKNFRKFTHKYIKNSSYIIKDDNNPNLNDMYDFFSIGSDQVWNCTFRNISSIDFLLFADKNKTISYAPVLEYHIFQKN